MRITARRLVGFLGHVGNVVRIAPDSPDHALAQAMSPRSLLAGEAQIFDSLDIWLAAAVPASLGSVKPGLFPSLWVELWLWTWR